MRSNAVFSGKKDKKTESEYINSCEFIVAVDGLCYKME